MQGYICQRQLLHGIDYLGPTERFIPVSFPFKHKKKFNVSGSIPLLFCLLCLSFLLFFCCVHRNVFVLRACLSVTASLTALLGHTLSGQGRTVPFIVGV
jgi:hypothetical protein